MLALLRRAGLVAAGLLAALIGPGLGIGGARAQAIDLELVAGGLARPTSIAHAGDGSGRLFVTLQGGRIVIHDGAGVLPTPFLDIGALVSCCGERGLLGLAFHPDYASNGVFFVNYTDLAGDTVVARYAVSADPNVADPATAAVLLTIGQPDDNHNGGHMQFGPDGFLYIAVGDGGGVGDPGDNGQDLGVLLGKILRIDVDGASPYAIPPGNPFVGVAGAAPEIWAYGLRNPWRFSFDRQTGDLYIADVGQGAVEEVDFQPAGSAGGENYGWRRMEGSQCYDPPAGCDDGSLVLPIIEYPHAGGACSITGGYRYRGARFPQFEGVYVYADYCSGQISGASESFAGAWSVYELRDTALRITAFGEDEAGELYLASHNIADPGAGALWRITPTFPVCDVELSQPGYVGGETITMQVFRVANPGPYPVRVEIKAWMEFPTLPAFRIRSFGADGSLWLPAGFDRDLAPMAVFTVTPAMPRGAYELNCRVSSAVTGGAMALDVNPFDVQ